MSNSSLVSYTNISPHKNSPRNAAVDRISPHCIVGQWTAKQGCDYFATTGRDCSANYVIGLDGAIGLSVDEADRSWCTSSSANDNRAITIECASDTTSPYAMTDAVYESLINLCVDICKRYGKKKLLWFNDKDKTLAYEPASDEVVITVHRWFANKSCPGDWLYSRLGDLAAKVTAQLSDNSSSGTLYRVQTGAYTKKENADAQLAKVKAAGFDTYMVQAGGYYKIQVGAYSKKENADAMAAKLKAAGFDTYITTEQGTAVSSSGTVATNSLAIGDKVKLASNAPVYGSTTKFQSWVYSSTLYVREINGSRVVISTQKTGAVTGAVDKKYLTKV